MAKGKKISQLDPIEQLTGVEQVPVVKDGQNYKTSISDIVGMVSLPDTSNLATKDDLKKKQDKLPEEGKVGDVLTKTENSIEWKKALSEDDLNSYLTKEEADETFAKQDGSYPNLTVGTAVNLEGKKDIINDSAYRTSANDEDIQFGTADIQSIKGNAIAWNQLVKNGNFANGTNWVEVNGSSFSVENNILTNVFSIADGKTDVYTATHISNVIKGHKYIGIVEYYFISGENQSTQVLNVQIKGNNNFAAKAYNKWDRVFSNVIEADGISSNTFVLSCNKYGLENKFRNAQLFDLTLIYGAGNEPTTPEQFEADYQRWFGKPLEYEEYDEGSIRSVKATGIKTVGFNLWDEEWELGGIYNGAPANDDFSINNRIRSKNFCRILPNTNYYLKCGAGTGEFWVAIVYYDINKNYISGVYISNKTFQSPSNAAYFKLFTNNGTYIYGNKYNNDICLNLVWSGKRDGEYEPHWEETEQLPITTLKGKLNGEGESVTVFPDGLKKAGGVYDEIYVENGVTKAVKRVGRITFNELQSYAVINSLFIFWVPGGAKFTINESRSLCSKYTNQLGANSETVTNKSYYLNAGAIGNSIGIKDNDYTDVDAFKNANVDTILYYELAEPEVYIIDDFYLPVNYKVDDFGTEQILMPEDSVAPIITTRYGINAVDTLRRLNERFIKNPTVGTDGQVLTKTKTGIEWKDVPEKPHCLIKLDIKQDGTCTITDNGTKGDYNYSKALYNGDDIYLQVQVYEKSGLSKVFIVKATLCTDTLDGNDENIEPYLIIGDLPYRSYNVGYNAKSIRLRATAKVVLRGSYNIYDYGEYPEGLSVKEVLLDELTYTKANSSISLEDTDYFHIPKNPCKIKSHYIIQNIGNEDITITIPTSINGETIVSDTDSLSIPSRKTGEINIIEIDNVYFIKTIILND